MSCVAGLRDAAVLAAGETVVFSDDFPSVLIVGCCAPWKFLPQWTYSLPLLLSRVATSI